MDLALKGRVRLQVHDAGSGLLVASSEADNVCCTAGLNYLAGQQNLMYTPDYSVGAAQTVRLVLGILF